MEVKNEIIEYKDGSMTINGRYFPESFTHILENNYPRKYDLTWLLESVIKEGDKRKKKVNRDREYQKKYYQENRETLDAYHKDYLKNNPDIRSSERQKARERYHKKK
jgi:hypothetical protein